MALKKRGGAESEDGAEEGPRKCQSTAYPTRADAHAGRTSAPPKGLRKRSKGLPASRGGALRSALGFSGLSEGLARIAVGSSKRPRTVVPKGAKVSRGPGDRSSGQNERLRRSWLRWFRGFDRGPMGGSGALHTRHRRALCGRSKRPSYSPRSNPSTSPTGRGNHQDPIGMRYEVRRQRPHRPRVTSDFSQVASSSAIGTRVSSAAASHQATAPWPS